MEVHINTQGMTDKGKTVALITEIFNNICVKKKKKKSKEIRAENRKLERNRKTKKKYNL